MNVPDVAPPVSRSSIKDIETGLRFFEKVKVSTGAAAESAERELQGATVVDIGYDVQDAVMLYRAKIEIGGKIADAMIDADSKAVIRKSTTAEDLSKVADFKRLGLPLSEVVLVGETCGEERAASTSIDHADGKLIFHHTGIGGQTISTRAKNLFRTAYRGMRITGINRRNRSPRISRPQATCISQRCDRAV
ncbi:MAG: hypothetical protein WBB98_21870 [Xanthobacteraceae bacterium]